MRTQRHKITYLNPTDIEVVVLGQLGRSTQYIQAATGLTPAQIQYRLTKAKNGEGMKAGQGYRSTWRDGSSPVARLVEFSVRARLRRQVKVTLPPLFVRVNAFREPANATR